MASYRVIRKLGEGGMGVVYLAHQTSLDRKVALKLLTQASREKESFVHRFVREVRTSTKVAHPNIIKILDYGEIEGQPFYAMEYLEAETVDDHLRRRGPLPPAHAARIGEQLLDALGCMHRAGLVHRDLKPANAMIDEQGHVTLMDFGLVKDLDRTPMTAHGKIVGTPGYLAPETILGKPIDGRADLFSLGILLYELLAGQRPFQGETLQAVLMAVVTKPHAPLAAVRPDVPEALASFIDRLLAKDPSDRFANAAAALKELRRAGGAAVDAAPDDASVDPIEGLGTLVDESLTLPQGSIEGGLDELANVPVAPPKAIEPPRKTTRTRAEKRLTTKFPHAAPPPPPPPAARPVAPVLAAVVGGGAVLAAWMISVRGTPAPSPSPAPTIAASMALAADRSDLAQLGSALEAAIAQFDPLAQIDALRADLLLADPKKGTWYDEAPGREVVSCRARWLAKLTRLAEESGLAAALAAFEQKRDAYFTDPGVAARPRLALYLKLHDLMDLSLWCARCRVSGAPDARRGFARGYGMVEGGRLEGQPGFMLEFELQESYKPGQLQVLATPAGFERVPVKQKERYFAKGDSRENDLIGAIEDMNKERMSWEYPLPLPLPPLDRIEELELVGVASDLALNNRFVVALAEDDGPMRDVAVIRGDGSPPVRVVHTLDRALFSGRSLRLSVRFRLIRDMLAWTEYGNFPRVGLRYRLKR